MGRTFSTGLVLSAVMAAVCAAPSDAAASVTGKRGIEIEGPKDRRGFFVGVGGYGGVTFFEGRDAAGFAGVDLALGGGVTKRFTLGVDLRVMPYFTSPVGLGVGGDIEATGYVFRGLFLRIAAGALALPKGADDNDFVAGIGGRAGVGYEFFLNASAALGVALDFDLRAVPGAGVNPGGTLGFRFSWY